MRTERALYEYVNELKSAHMAMVDREAAYAKGYEAGEQAGLTTGGQRADAVHLETPGSRPLSFAATHPIISVCSTN